MKMKLISIFLIMMSGLMVSGFGELRLIDSDKTAHPTATQTSAATQEPKIDTTLFEFIGSEKLMTFAENFEENFPVSVSVLYQSVDGGEPYYATDEATIRAVFEALSRMVVLEEAGWGHTDDYLNYYFEMPDGSTIGGFSFQGGKYLGPRMNLYKVSGFSELYSTLNPLETEVDISAH